MISKYILMASAITLGIVLPSKSRAAELPLTGSCGSGCLYEITTDSTTGEQNLRVYNDPNYTGTTKNIKSEAFTSSYDYKGTHYNYYDNTQFNTITIDGDFDTIGNYAFKSNGAKNVVFNGNVKNIGYAAFEYNNLTSVNLPESLQTIEGEAFYSNKISSLTIPDSVTSIGNWAFAGDNNLTSVNMSDTLENLGDNGVIYHPFGSKSNLSIICKGDVEKCESLVKEYRLKNAAETTDLSDHVIAANQSQCTGEKYFWNGTSCSRKEAYCDNNMYYTGSECIMRPEDSEDIVCDYEGTGYIKVGDSCYSPYVTYAKKHYTPAEANQWLKDDNNSVTITFKK